jgi:hypothetical protein
MVKLCKEDSGWAWPVDSSYNSKPRRPGELSMHFIRTLLTLSLLLCTGASQACSWQDPLSCVNTLTESISSAAKAVSARATTKPEQLAGTEAPCPFFDMGACHEQRALKAQHDLDESRYQQQLQIASAHRIGGTQDDGWVNSASSACSEAHFDLHSDDGQRCLQDVDQQYAKYTSRLRSGQEKIVSCREWAISKGAKWEAAQADMQLDADQAVTPVMFKGEVESGKGGQLTIKHYSDSACVSVGHETFVLNRASLRVGQELRGYGMQTGKQMVAMIDGQSIKVPVIEAACLE